MEQERLQSPIELILDGEHLTPEQVYAVAHSTRVRVQIAPEARKRMERSRAWVEQLQQSGRPIVYGINTGFGSKASVSISQANLRELQHNLIKSHAAGTGEPLPIEVVRAAILLRAQTLVKGYSGIRPRVVETLLRMLERNVVPWIPAQGSLGASGDLAPLSHLALVLSKSPQTQAPDWSGKAYWYNETANKWVLLSGREAMDRAGIARVVLEAREGLALNNGTQISTALLTLAYYQAGQLVKMADIAMAMSLEALLGITRAFREEIHRLRPHPGQLATARNIRRLIQGSQLVDTHPERVQDAYSLRCHPQVMAGVRDTLDFIRRVLEVELNATTDNPIIVPDLKEENRALSGGNFHAQPIAFAADFLATVLCEVGNIAERRIFRLSDRHLNQGLPSFLCKNGGLENGLMIAQYTAAALVSENKSLAHPASIDSIPTCENQEDHVSMAPIAARKAWQILHNVQKIVAIELLFAAQAIDLRLEEAEKRQQPEKVLGAGTAVAYQIIRQHVEPLVADRPLYTDIDTLTHLMAKGSILKAVEKRVGVLD